MTKFKFLNVALALCFALSVTAHADTYWWKDDKGVTQIGEVVPPEFTGNVIKHLDAKGRELKDKHAAQQNQETPSLAAERKAALEQRRQDNSLLQSYSNEQEIDSQRDKNLEPVTAHINGIHLRQQAVQERLDGFHKEANGKQITNPSLQSDIDKAEKDLAVLKQELDAANQEEESIKAKYEARKIRYRELTGGTRK